MNRRSFIQSIAIVGFGNLFLPRALDRFRWKAPTMHYGSTIMVNPNYVDAPFEMKGCDISGVPIGYWFSYPLRFVIPVDPSNREEVKRHSIPPFIRVPKI